MKSILLLPRDVPRMDRTRQGSPFSFQAVFDVCHLLGEAALEGWQGGQKAHERIVVPDTVTWFRMMRCPDIRYQ
jgi:hypothetical protein